MSRIRAETVPLVMVVAKTCPVLSMASDGELAPAVAASPSTVRVDPSRTATRVPADSLQAMAAPPKPAAAAIVLVGSAADDSGVPLTVQAPEVAMTALSTVVVPESVRSHAATPLPSVASATRRPAIVPVPANAPDGVATGAGQRPALVAVACSMTFESSQNAVGVPLTMET